MKCLDLSLSIGNIIEANQIGEKPRRTTNINRRATKARDASKKLILIVNMRIQPTTPWIKMKRGMLAFFLFDAWLELEAVLFGE